MFQATRMLKHSSIYAVGNLSRQLVSFIMLPVYTRYLSPADYGIVGLLIFMVSLIELVFGARMFNAVPKFYYEQSSKAEAHRVISTALLVTSAVSIVTVLVTVGLSDRISGIMFGSADHGLLVSLFAVLILTQALENYSLGYIRIQQRPWLFISATTFKLVLQLSLNILFVVILKKGVLGIAVSSVISSLLYTSALTLYTLWHTGIGFSTRIASKLLVFSWPLWLSGLAALYVGSSNRYFLRLFGSLDEVGLFELAARFGSIIMVLVWMPFSQYWQTERFNIYNQPDPKPIYKSVFGFIAALMILAAMGVSIFGSPVIRLMAAEDFHAAAKAVPYLAFAAVLHCLVFFVNFSFFVKEKTGWLSWISYVTAGFATLFYFLLIPSFGFIGAAQALMLANGAQFLIIHFAAKRHYDMDLSLIPLATQLTVSAVCISLAFHFEQAGLIEDVAVKSVIYALGCGLILAPFLRRPVVRNYIERLTRRSRTTNPAIK